MKMQEGTKADVMKKDDGSVSKGDIHVDSYPQNIKSIIATRRIVIDQIGSGFEQARELILEIARQLDEGGLYERNHIARTIKKILKDKIEQGKVTEKWIEECLAPEYKQQYTKSEPSSLSKQQPKQQIIEISTEGKQVSPEQQNDDKGIDGLTEIQPSNKMDSADILNQQSPAGELEVVEDKNRSELEAVIVRVKQELRSPFEDGDERVKHKVSHEVGTTAAVKDELTFQLSSACSFKIDENSQVIHITHKYYDRADFVLYRINIYKPPPDFIINLSDIAPKLQSELEELYKSSPETFDWVVTEAVQSILESINHRYYHVSNIAYKVSWRFEP